MELIDVVNKLVGKIEPIGETREDDRRFENLKAMTKLVNELVAQIEHVSYYYADCSEFSKKRASDYASKFLDDIGNDNIPKAKSALAKRKK